MSDESTNTEKLTKGEGRAVRALGVAGRVFIFALDVVLFIAFTWTLYLILTKHFDYPTVIWCVVSGAYILADAVNQGIKRAMAGIKFEARSGDDTPGNTSA